MTMAPENSAPQKIMSWQSALDIMARAGLPRADQHRILALHYPVEYRAFWRVLDDLGMTEERLMDRMGGSP
jgi:hypothetical protein